MLSISLRWRFLLGLAQHFQSVDSHRMETQEAPADWPLKRTLSSMGIRREWRRKQQALLICHDAVILSSVEPQQELATEVTKSFETIRLVRCFNAERNANTS